MNEKEIIALCKLIINRITELADIRHKMSTDAGNEAIDAEIEFMRELLEKVNKL